MRRKDNSSDIQYKRFAYKAGPVDEAGVFTGYGSVFGNVDSYNEIVMPGAFAKSLKSFDGVENPLPMLWQHKSDEPIGGYTELEEDSRGLKVKGFLLKDEVARAAEAYALMKARVVKGLSIGYYVIEDEQDKKSGSRLLHELDLHEISPVTFAANGEARVEGIKAAFQQMLKAGQLPALKDFEDFLREAGFSKTQAAFIANNGLSKLHRGEPDGEKGEILNLLSNFKLTR